MATDAPVNDVDDSQLEVTPPKSWAAGVPGVYHSLVTSQQQMGVRRSTLTLLRVNQHDGFDCPGCAWPEPHHRKTAEFCENGAKAVAEEATLRRVTRDFFAEHPVSELCPAQRLLARPAGSAHRADAQGSRQRPLRADLLGRGVPASSAGELTGLDSPDEAVFYTSGRTSNEAAFLYQLFARQLGTNNLPDCSNMCHESSGSALTETIGVGKGSVTLDDVHQADLIIIVGQNPGTNHPRMLTALEEAKGNGAKIIAVNPLPEAGLDAVQEPAATLRRPRCGRRPRRPLPARSGSTATWPSSARWPSCSLEAEDAAPGTVLDQEFIAEHTHGLRRVRRSARATSRGTTLDAQRASPATRSRPPTSWCSASKRIIVCWAMGLTQHKNSVPTIREVVNFLLLRGNIGRPGAGVCPVRGHSNVQGDRTMGIWEKSPDRLPRRAGHGVRLRAAARARLRRRRARSGRCATATSTSSSPWAATSWRPRPTPTSPRPPCARARLTVHVSTKLNRSHIVTGERGADPARASAAPSATSRRPGRSSSPSRTR